MSVRRLKLAIPVTIFVFVVALVGGFVIGTLPAWQLHLPPSLPLNMVAGQLNEYTGFFFGHSPVLSIAWQNGRILLGALILAMFTFGAGALILTPAVYVVIGYLFSQVIAAGYNPLFMIPAILTHGIVEIPVIVLATPRGWTVGQAWSAALGDALKIGLGIIVPGLLVAAILEAYVTPLAIRLVLGG
jgi:uncharacterized membrane protein SpoIIM required for sporulation